VHWPNMLLAYINSNVNLNQSERSEVASLPQGLDLNPAVGRMKKLVLLTTHLNIRFQLKKKYFMEFYLVYLVSEKQNKK
jgi:hypothetical protein